MNLRFQLVVIGLSIGALLLSGPVTAVASQDQPPCPFTSDSVVAPVLGNAVHGVATSSTAGFDSCEFGDYTLYRQSSAEVSNNGGLGGLAQNVVLSLPPAVAAQIGALEPGRAIELPGYQVATLTGLGDAALWVKDTSFGVDALLVQRGGEVFAFQVLDRPDAQATSIALAQAVLADAPAAVAPSVPVGNRPKVIADCGLDAANAVADRLSRADVSIINVIGGCHYVAIATTLNGGGLIDAPTAQQICDTATEVAYGPGILGITVTDGTGHERASGADGQPCSGFP